MQRQNQLPVQLYKADEPILGETYGTWTAEWWKAYYISSSARRAQPVFFMPGKLVDTNNEKKVKERHFVVRAGVPILFTILNWISIDNKGNREDREMIAEATHRMDVISDMSFILNDDKTKESINLESMKTRVRSPFFMLNGRKSLSDGYWVFLKSLPKGDYTISSHGACSMRKTQIDMEYHIYVR